VKQVCVSGNSHAACMKLAWNRLETRFPNIGITFFAVRRAGMSALQPTPDGVLVPMSQRVSLALTHTSGGSSVIDLKRYDVVLLVGLTACYPKFGCYTYAVARQAMLDHIPTTLAYETVQKIRSVSGVPIFLAHEPLRVEGTETDEDSDVIALRARGDGFVPYRRMIDAINEELFSGLEARCLPQPAQTITKCFYTRSEYGVGSVRLDLGDGQEENEDDRSHMNQRFGDIFLSTHLRAIAYQ
jgi:hypothetical protein